MIDLFTLALTHGLIALALWRMLFREDLDLDQGESPGGRPSRPRQGRAAAEDGGGA